MAKSKGCPGKGICSVLLLLLIAVLVGCDEGTPQPEGATAALAGEVMASPRPSGTSPPAASPTARPTETAVPATSTPTATPLPPTPTPTPLLSEVDLGVPGGDCFGALAVVEDPEAKRLYALCDATDAGPADALAVVDTASGERLGTLLLGGESVGDSDLEGHLALDAQAGRLYAVSDDLGALVVVDTATLDPIGELPGVKTVLSAPGRGRFYAYSDQALAVYDAGDLAERGRLPVVDPVLYPWELLLVYNPADDRLYHTPTILAYANEPTSIQVRRGEDLALETDIPLSGYVRKLAVDDRSGQVYAVTWSGLITIDPDSYALSEQPLDAPDSQAIVDRLFGEEAAQDLVPSESGDAILRTDPASGEAVGRYVLGRRLLAVAIHPGSGRLYVLDSGGGLQVVDGGTLETLQARPDLLGTARADVSRRDAVDLALDPLRERLFVADVEGERTLVLDLNTLEPVGELDVAGALAVDAAGGQLFVATGDVFLFDTDTLEPRGAPPGEPVLSYKPGPDEPSVPSFTAIGVLFDEARRRLLVHTYVGGSAHVSSTNYGVYDGDTLAYVGSLSTKRGGPTYLASAVLLPAGEGMVASYTGGANLSQGPIEWTGRQGLAFYSDNCESAAYLLGLTGQFLGAESPQPEGAGRLYLLRQQDLLLLDADGGFPLGGLPLDRAYLGGSLDPERGRLVLWGGDRLVALDTEAFAAAAVEPQADLLPYDPEGYLYASPHVETDHTLFAAFPAQGLYRSQDDGATWQFASWGLQNLFLDGVSFSPEVEADGAIYAVIDSGLDYVSTDGGESWVVSALPLLAYSSDESGDKEIYLARYDRWTETTSGDPLRLTDDPAEDDNPDWSPDGQRLVFQSDRSGNQDLWLVNRDGSGLVQLTSDPADDVLPAWEPSGERIAFVSTRDGNPEIYVMAAPQAGQAGDESTLRRLTDHPAGDWRPAWVPGEVDRIAFASTRDGDNEIYLMNDDGSGLRQLTDNDADDRDPAWHNGYVYFVSDRGGNFDLYLVDPAGGEASPVAGSPFDEGHVASGPTSGATAHRMLLFTSDRGWGLGIYSLITGWSDAGQVIDGPGDQAAPAWSPGGEVVTIPPAPVASPLPVVSPTPATTPTPGASPPPPVLMGTPVPRPRAVISAENAGRVTQLARWGGGDAQDLAYAPDGSLVAAGTSDGIVLYDAQTLEPLALFGTGSSASKLAFSPDGEILAAVENALSDVPLPELRLYRVGGCASQRNECGSLLGTTGRGRWVYGLVFTPDGELLATGYEDGSIWLWEVGACASLPPGSAPAEGCGRLSRNIETPIGAQTLAFGPAPGVGDGADYVLAVSSSYRSGLLRASDGSLLYELEGMTDRVTALALRPDGQVLAAGLADGSLWLWKVADGRLLQTLAGHSGEALRLAFSPDGSTLASVAADQVVKSWEVGGCEAGSGECGRELASLELYGIEQAVFAPDLATMTSASPYSQVALWDLETGDLLEIAANYTDAPETMAFHPSGNALATGQQRGFARLWDVGDGRLLQRLPEAQFPAFSPDGLTLAAPMEGDAVGLWRIARCSDHPEGCGLHHTLEGHTAAVTQVAYRPDGQMLASASLDGTVRLWAVEDARPLRTLEGHTNDVAAVAFGPDGALLASASFDGSVRLWWVDTCLDAPEGELCGRLAYASAEKDSYSDPRPASLAFSPRPPANARGEWLLASGWSNGDTGLWQVAACAGQEHGDLCVRPVRRMRGNPVNIVTSVAFSPDGSLLASAIGEPVIPLWRVADGHQVAALAGHGRSAMSVAFSPDGTLLASSAADDTVRLWGIGED